MGEGYVAAGSISYALFNGLVDFQRRYGLLASNLNLMIKRFFWIAKNRFQQVKSAGTYSEFAQENRMPALGICFLLPCSSTGCRFAAAATLVLVAFITRQSSLEPLLEGLLTQIYIDLSWRVVGRNRAGDLRMTQICEVPRSSPLSYGDGCITGDPSGSSLRSLFEYYRPYESMPSGIWGYANTAPLKPRDRCLATPCRMPYTT